jgi:serine/threonine protein kinase
MDTRYVEFLDKDTYFYKPPIGKKHSFGEIKVNDQWLVNQDTDWKYYINRTHNLPKQGWKIHVTSVISEAQKCLDVVTPFLIKNEISFKYVPNMESLITKNSKYGDRASSGKFITIYPQNNEEFEDLLSTLPLMLEDFKSGAYILNDKQWFNSNVFFRYGAFKEMYVNSDGVKTLAIETPDGKLIPDIRAPFYEVPSFIEEPLLVQHMTIEQEKVFEKEDTSEFDKYEVISALHFSNAGGVYKVKYQGKELVMKEGRKESGIDRLGRDGFTRLKNEYLTLKKLSDKNGVVNVYDYFEVWENNYLIEECLQGSDISDYVAQNFPFSKRQNKNDYARDALKIVTQLKDILIDLHKDGFAIGDLQPNNVMVKSDGNIKLIDLETSTRAESRYNPGLQTPGFVLHEESTFAEADWFAFWRIIRFLFLPIEPVSDLSADIEKQQDKSIGKYFSLNIYNQIQELREFVSRYVNLSEQKHNMLSAPNMEFDESNIDNIIKSLRNGIVNKIDSRLGQLGYGDIRQYTDHFGAYSVAYGGFGIVMALNRTGSLPKEALMWSRKTGQNILNDKNKYVPYGLFNGISGVANVLFEIGETALAEEILKKIELKNLNEDLTIYSGLAGIGLTYLSFYKATGNDKYLEKSISIASMIKEHYLQNKSLGTKDEFAIANGFLNGWSGVSLFLLELGVLAAETKYTSLAVKIMRKELHENVVVDKDLQTAQVADFSLGKERLIPYLGEGAIGIALCIFEFDKYVSDFKDDKTQLLLKQLCNIEETYCTYTSGLMRGSTGFLVLQAAQKNVDHQRNLDITILRNYLLKDEKGNLYTPGDYGYRCSLDLFTGNAGTLLVLADIRKGNWNGWLPLIYKNNLNLFSNETERR